MYVGRKLIGLLTTLYNSSRLCLSRTRSDEATTFRKEEFRNMQSFYEDSKKRFMSLPKIICWLNCSETHLLRAGVLDVLGPIEITRLGALITEVVSV